VIFTPRYFDTKPPEIPPHSHFSFVFNPEIFAMTRFHSCFLLSLALLACMVTGCGKATGNISGVVKYNGKPLPGGSVMFVDSSGAIVQTAIAEDGKFTASKVAIGNNKVAVSYVDDKINQYAQEIAAKGKGSLKPITNMPKLDTANMLTLPAKYSMPDQSGLYFDVKSGENTYDIDLK